MAMLNFKYGLYKNLPEYDANKLGTIFVTSDEHAMYVDLPKTAENPDGRVRLGQIISIPTANDWAQLKPPYSTDAFYYIVEANALLKYVGTKTGENGSTEHDWRQINSTKLIEEQIAALTGRVKAIEDENFAGKITAINQNIADLGETDKALTQAIEGLATAANAMDARIDARIDGIDTVLNYRGVVDNLPGDGNLNQICVWKGKVHIYTADGWTEWSDKNVIAAIEDLKTRMGGMATSGTVTALTGRVETVENALNHKTTGLIGRTGALESRVDNLDDAVFDNQGANLVEANAQAIAGLETEIGTTKEDLANYKTANNTLVENAQKAADDAQDTADEAKQAAINANNNANTRVSQDEFNDFKETNTDAIADAKKAGTDAQKTINDYVTTNNGVIDGINKVIKGIKNGTNINSFGAVEANYATKNEAQGYANTVKTTLLGNSADTSTTGATIYDVKRAAAAAQKDINDYKTANNQAIQNMKNELEQRITNDMQTADAMVFKDVVASVADLIAQESTAKVGYTYKAADEFTLTQGDNVINVYIGDLLIATGTENNETGIINNVTWKHIPSGYVADYNPKMTLITEAPNSATINLKSGVDSPLGRVAVAAAENSSVTVAAEGTQLTIGMAWGQF